MKRRQFLSIVGGAAGAWPLLARAQQPTKLPTIGFLGTSTPVAWRPWIAAFVQRLRELGWIEGRTVAIEVRWAEGKSERFAEIAAEFVRLNVDVIVTSGAAAPASKRMTSSIPIVFMLANDPVGTGIVASLSRPGSNVTGLSNQSGDLAGKRLELLREVIPDLRSVAVLVNVANAPGGGAEVRAVNTAARTLRLEIITLEIRRAEEIEPAIETLNGKAGAVYVVQDPLFIATRDRISTSALSARLPTVHPPREFVEAGGLMSYGASFPDTFRRAADYVDKILKGTKPGDLPIEQPTKFELVLNQTTAKGLALNLSPALLARADEVIE
jgi:putative tryptophan/tyrosine transport system substrate-binding protein